MVSKRKSKLIFVWHLNVSTKLIIILNTHMTFDLKENSYDGLRAFNLKYKVYGLIFHSFILVLMSRYLF